MSHIQRGREIWYAHMNDTIRYFRSHDMSFDKGLEYITSKEELQLLIDPRIFIGCIIATFEHPIMFTKTFYYSIKGFINSF